MKRNRLGGFGVTAVLCLGLVLTLGVAPGLAQESKRSGTHNLCVGGRFTAHTTNQPNADTDYTLTGQFSYGYFIRTNWLIGARWLSAREWSGLAVGKTNWDWLMGQIRYRWVMRKKFVPYGGFQVGMSKYQRETPADDFSSSSLGYGGILGLEWPIGRSKSFFVEYNLLAAKHKEQAGANIEPRHYHHEVYVGVMFYF